MTAGSSVHLAAKAVSAKAKRLASHLMDIDEAALDLVDGRVSVRGGNNSVSLGELAGILRGAPGYGFPADLEPGLSAAMHWRSDALAYANACHVVEVEVDVALCHVRIERYVAFHDSGRRINPMIVDGQVVGGIVHGIGNALYELMAYDEAAQPLTTTLADYLLPTAAVVPMTPLTDASCQYSPVAVDCTKFTLGPPEWPTAWGPQKVSGANCQS